MTNINTILKNRKNKKGFSLIELIVVLVIMAILAAALVPSLIGYINQSRQNTATNECASVVSAAQTIASSAYADPSGAYYDESSKKSIVIAEGDATWTDSEVVEITAVKTLSEVEGTISKIVIENGKVTAVNYATKNGQKVQYSSSATKPYTPVEDWDSGSIGSSEGSES